VVKHNAPDLLRKFFDNKNWRPAPISLSGNTDCYQPIERKMKLTRQMLEICLEYRNPVSVLSKNALVLRDADILEELAKLKLVRVFSSITSTDEELRQKLEPRTATYKSRFKVVSTLAAKGIPTGIMNAPIIPGLNDHHMNDVLKAAAEAGALWAGYTVVRLNGAIGDVFKDWLFKAFPDRAEKVWNMICSCHEGHVNDSRWRDRMVGDGRFAELIRTQFKLYCRRYGLNQTEMEFDLTAFRRPGRGGQLSLFD
jgi:DNA repair photolyase